MKKKKLVIAIIGDFPMQVVCDNLPQRKTWKPTPWLMALFDAFKQNEDLEIHWLNFCRGIWRTRRVESEGQHFHILPCGSLTVSQKTYYLAERLRVCRELNLIKPDLVHAWGTENRYSFSAKDFPVKKVLSIQGLLKAYHQNDPLPPFLERQIFFEKLSLEAYDLLTGESPWCIENARQMVPEKPFVSWDYAVEQRFFAAARHLDEKPVCLLGGTPTTIKNVETAIAAFSRPELSHVTLLMAGIPEGAYGDLPANIKPLGGVSRDGMVELMSRAWCLVHPSLADTGPTIVKEARVMGLPVVVSSHCGSQQYVEHGRSGFILEPMDVQGFVDAVLNVTSSKENAMRMGEYGRAACRNALSSETMLANLMAIYDDMLA